MIGLIGFPGAYASYYDQVDQHGIAFDRAPMSLAQSGTGTIHIRANEQQMAAVAAYYETLGAPPAEPETQPMAQTQKRGQMLVTLGGDKAGVQACAKRLLDADISAVSAWFASRFPPAPAVLRVNLSAGSGARSAAPGTSGAGTKGGGRVPASGAGVEQGSPTTGGSQGPGGGRSASGKRSARQSNWRSKVNSVHLE